jgi:L-rhamnose isomerase
MNTAQKIEKAYEEARERYAEWGVDTEKALERLAAYPVSLHCWQGDDVGGFERPDAALSGGGIQVTGNHPGKARNPEELRMDLDKACSLIPGRHRLNLHAIYGEFGGKRVDRDAIEPRHFEGWIHWARERGFALDFNASCFSHPRADEGFTLSSADEGIRSFWIEHVNRCREISAAMGRAQGTPCLHNLWIPDGTKDLPADRHGPRRRLAKALDRIYDRPLDPSEMKDSLESKLFGIGSESYVVGSHDFYLGYALTRGKMICLDLGHYHPTESVADKISALLPFLGEILLHVSRGVRWDSDHVVILDDDLQHLAREIVRSPRPEGIHIALDFFDATLNRVGAWVIGTRAVLKALLVALLSPQEKLLGHEVSGDLFARLALMEEAKTMPFGAVWDRHCAVNNVPPRDAWMEEIRTYEEQVTRRRGD